jgi:hypothetical protein
VGEQYIKDMRIVQQTKEIGFEPIQYEAGPLLNMDANNQWHNCEKSRGAI